MAQGFKRVHDFNGAEQNGADGYPVDVVDGVRQNTGLAYLTAEVRSRSNLNIVCGELGTGVTALAWALSMLGYRCCSDMTDLPSQEYRALFDGGRTQLFDAYVNVGSIGPSELLHLAKMFPESRFIATSYCEEACHCSGKHGLASTHAEDDCVDSARQSDLSLGNA